jgi:cytochrome c oxidase assembly protein subunit 15
MNQNKKFAIVLVVLSVMIVTLMALGAGVRTMNAGLSCPDWPLCFGKIIPDFHPAVWFEFVHRAYAGLVALVFAACFFYVLRLKTAPPAAKYAAVAGLFFLLMQIVAGALTVLWLVKWAAVTSHLLLATLFFCSVLWILFQVHPAVESPTSRAPRALRLVTGLLAVFVFLQIALGGIVASTYAGSVCVDWPLCNGQWVPAWQGAIGHQVSHRFFAYFLAIAIAVYALVIQMNAKKSWVTPQILRLSRMNAAVVVMQVCVGVANLLLFIPPWVTVVHQSMAILLLAVNLRTYFVARLIARSAIPAAPAQTSTQAFSTGVSG